VSLGAFVPYTISYFVAYEKFKRMASQWYHQPPASHSAPDSHQPLPVYMYTISAAGSSGVAAACSNFLDLVGDVLCWAFFFNEFLDEPSFHTLFLSSSSNSYKVGFFERLCWRTMPTAFEAGMRTEIPSRSALRKTLSGVGRSSFLSVKVVL
jgi:hypothetical protein